MRRASEVWTAADYAKLADVLAKLPRARYPTAAAYWESVAMRLRRSARSVRVRARIIGMSTTERQAYITRYASPYVPVGVRMGERPGVQGVTRTMRRANGRRSVLMDRVAERDVLTDADQRTSGDAHLGTPVSGRAAYLAALEAKHQPSSTVASKPHTMPMFKLVPLLDDDA